MVFYVTVVTSLMTLTNKFTNTIIPIYCRLHYFIQLNVVGLDSSESSWGWPSSLKTTKIAPFPSALGLN